jgi:hypothetical protein
MRWFLGFIIPYSVYRKNLFVFFTEIYRVLVLTSPCIRGNYLKTCSEKRQKKNLCLHGEDAKRLLVYSPNKQRYIKVCSGISQLIIIRILKIFRFFLSTVHYMGWIKPKNHLATVSFNMSPLLSSRNRWLYKILDFIQRGTSALFSVHALFFILHLSRSMFWSLTQPPLTLRLKVYYLYEVKSKWYRKVLISRRWVRIERFHENINLAFFHGFSLRTSPPRPLRNQLFSLLKK